MRALWFGIQWAVRQLVFLASLVTAAVALLLLPALVVPNGRINGFGYVIDGFRIEIRPYWSAVRLHLRHLAKGQLIPPPESLPAGHPLTALPEQLIDALPVTLKVSGTALVAGLVLGLSLGYLLSTLAPTWLRAPLWGGSTLLCSLPDLLIATFLTLAVFLVSRLRGESPSWGSDSWQRFWAPAIALTLIVLPYIARVTATAIEEIIGQPYIRAAVARGIPPAAVLFRYVGKGVLIRLATVLPVVVSLLLSSGAVVEYMMEVRGVGRLLLLSAATPTANRYAGVALLVPLLLLVAGLLTLSELIQRWLDPRLGPTGTIHPTATRGVRLGLPTFQTLTRGIVSVGYWLQAVPAALCAGLVGLPHRLRRGARDPVLLWGALLVLGLVAVAVAAPWLAPYDPAQKQVVLLGPNRQVEMPPFPPGAQYWLGSDEWGRDVLSRLLFGTRYALLFALLAAPARFLLAVPIGLLAAFRGGLWNRLIQWLATFFLALPQVLLPLALLPAVNQLFRNRADLALLGAVILIALPGAPRLAATVRQLAAEVLAQPFVEGAYAVGAGTTRTLLRYVAPQLFPQLVTMLALEIPALLTLTTLLGYFEAYPGGALFDTQTFRPVAPLLPEWGSSMERPLMLLLSGRWWLWAPFVALSLAVLAFTLLGEGLRRAWESRTDWKWSR